MSTTLAIDDKLLAEAVHLGGHRSKKAAVTKALKEYVERRRRMRILELAGKIDFDPSYDYKKARSRR